MMRMPELIKNYQWIGEKRPFNIGMFRRSNERRTLDNGFGRQTCSVI
jgi:hypothetical protein